MLRAARRLRRPAGTARNYATKAVSGHGAFYAELLPSMLPVALLGSAVYLGLHLTRGAISQEKYLEEADTRVHALEHEIAVLRAEQAAPVPAALATPTPAASKDAPKRGWLW